MRVLIAGCGDVGIALGRGLVAGGHQVFGLRRNPEGLPDSFESVAADLGEPATLSAVPESLDAVVYLAAADGRSDAAYEKAYVAGPRNLLSLCRARGESPRWLHASSTGVYAQADGSWVDEDSATEASHFSGRRLLEGESLVQRAELATTVVRLGGIYGPGRTRLIDRVRSGEARISTLPGSDPPGSRYTNRIHRDDAAAIFAHLLDKAPGLELAVGVDDDPAPEAEVLSWLAERLGVPIPLTSAPDPESRRGLSNKRCSNRRLRESGLVLAYPSYREGYEKLLQAPGGS